MNARHAVVSEAGRTVVITEDIDPVLQRRVLSRSSFQDIRNLYLNRLIKVGKDRDEKSETLGDYWLRHPERREYKGIVFDPGQETPGYFNLWRGFSVEPREGDWSLMRSHMHDTLCNGTEDHFRYLFAWMAAGVQRPSVPAEVALVLRGRRGTGKGIFGREFGALFGQHFVHVADARHLLGNFNAHLQDAVLVFSDEAFEAGDKRAEAVLKMIITEPTIPIERKHRDVIVARNVIHLLIASNEDWVVPAGLDERRFFVLEAGGDHAQDHEYFRRLVEQMDNGGRAAMLFDLLHFDLSTVDLRKVPATDALLEQKLWSMTDPERWWYDKLVDGRLFPHHASWQSEVSREELQQDYAAMCGHGAKRPRSIATHLGLQLKKLLPQGFPRGFQHCDPGLDESSTAQRRRYWAFPPLSECRKHFDKLTRTSHAWTTREGI